MKTLLTIAAGLALATVLSGCASTGGNLAASLAEIAKDPSCGHVDRVNLAFGGLTGPAGSVLLERTCIAKVEPPAPVAP
jgi:hypothetical protein